MTAKLRRIELGNKLKITLGSANVYFQPGPDVTMQYPAIVYERDNASYKSADNETTYAFQQRYQVTYIDRNPDSDVLDLLRKYPYSNYSRHFATSGLNHDVFVIYH